MSKMNDLPWTLLKFVASRPGAELCRIRSEASRRHFYRINLGKKSLVAMVYPEPARTEIERFCTIHKIYRGHGLRVPGIEAILDDRVLIQEDAGSLLLQRAWRAAGRGERQRLIEGSREILAALAAVPPALATLRLDRARLKWEMDFFIRNFVSRYPVRACGEMELLANLTALVEAIEPECVFAHRDFHSRNLLVLGREIVMVDFQDSLLAPRHYDLVSLVFDSYLDLGGFRELLLPECEWPANEIRQLRLTALQRNIKALGTFAHQSYECRHPAYARYIPRTQRHIRGHLQMLDDPRLTVLTKYFSTLAK